MCVLVVFTKPQVMDLNEVLCLHGMRGPDISTQLVSYKQIFTSYNSHPHRSDFSHREICNLNKILFI